MDRPRSREKNVTGPAKTVNKRGEGLGTGPVGAPRKQSGGESAGTRSSGTRSAGGFKMIILLAILFLGGGSGGLMAMLGGQTGQSQSGSMGLAAIDQADRKSVG